MVLVLAGTAIFWADSTIPTGFVPTEDRGVIFVNAELPPGSSLDRSYEVSETLYGQMQSVEGIRTATVIAGRNFFSGAGSSNAMGFIILDDWEDRETDETSVEGIIAQLNQKIGREHV